MSDINLRKKIALDGKETFVQYFTGSKTIKDLQEEAGNNLKLGKPYTRGGIWYAMWTWAMNNLDEAYEIFNKAMLDKGQFYSKEQWIEFVQNKAWTLFNKDKRKFEKWLRLQRLTNTVYTS